MIAPVAIGATAAGAEEAIASDPDIAKNSESDWSNIATTALGLGTIGAVTGGLLSASERRRITKGARVLAKYTDMEARQKVTGDLLDQVVKEGSPTVKPEFTHAVRRLQWLANKMEGAQLRYGDISKWRNEFREMYSGIKKDGADLINEALEGMGLNLEGLSPEDAMLVKSAFADIHQKMSTLNRQLNEQFRRLGLPENEVFGEVMGLHPSTAPQDGRNLVNIPRNLGYGAILGRATGVAKWNIPTIRKKIEDFLRSNTYHNGSEIVWNKHAKRSMLTVPVEMEPGVFMTPDQITSDLYEKWINKQTERNVKALFKDEHGLYNQDAETSYERKSPYLGPDVHGVSMEDFGNDLERRLRMLKGLKSLPDGTLADLKMVKEEIPLLKEGIKKITAYPEYDAISNLIEVLDGDKGLLADIDGMVGRPQADELGPVRRRISAAQNALTGITMQVLMNYRFMSAAKQSPQGALMAAAASNNWVPLLEITDQIRAHPFAKYLSPMWNATVARFMKEAHIDPLELIHSTDSKGMMGGWIDKLNAMKRQNEVLEAATVYRAVQNLKIRMFEPSFQAYAKRTWSPEDRAALVDAIKRNDDDVIKDLAATYIIKQLDMVNGSGVPTSRFNAFKGPIASATMTLANTPVRTAVKAIASRQRGAVNDAGSRAKNIALTARAGAAIAGQAATNAAVSAVPALKVGSLFVGGLPLYSAIMAGRSMYMDERSDAEKSNANKLATIAATFSRMPGNLADGELGGFASDAAGLAQYVAAETVAGKALDATDALYGLRSSYDRKLGTPKPYTPTVLGAIAGLTPSFSGIPGIVGNAISQFGQPSLLYSNSSAIPFIRDISPFNELDLRRAMSKPEQDALKKLEDARKGPTAKETLIKIK